MRRKQTELKRGSSPPGGGRSVNSQIGHRPNVLLVSKSRFRLDRPGIIPTTAFSGHSMAHSIYRSARAVVTFRLAVEDLFRFFICEYIHLLVLRSLYILSLAGLLLQFAAVLILTFLTLTKFECVLSRSHISLFDPYKFVLCTYFSILPAHYLLFFFDLAVVFAWDSRTPLEGIVRFKQYCQK